MPEENNDLMKEIKSVAEAQAKAWEAFKETNDANNEKHDAVLDAKLAKITEDLDGKSEELSAKLVKIEDAKKALADKIEAERAEVKERMSAMEVALARKPVGPADEVQAKHGYFEGWARAAIKSTLFGRDSLEEKEAASLAKAAQEMKDMTVGSDATGGFLAPAEYVREILKGVVEVSPFRTVASVRTTANRSLMIPKRTQTAAAGWTAEAATRTESQNPAFGMEEIPTHEMYAMIDISEQNLEDSAFNLEQFIRDEATEQFGVTEGAAFINGTAVGQPEGIMTNSSVGETVSGDANEIVDSAGTADGIINLYHALKTAYARNGTWLMNRTTLGAVRRAKDANDQYIWTPGLATLRPNTILDAPYVEMPDMPSEGANTYPIIFGDFRRGYVAVDRVSMSILRDPYTQATGGLIRFWFRRRVGGQVVIAESMRKLKCST